jgi:hypothetical protein
MFFTIDLVTIESRTALWLEKPDFNNRRMTTCGFGLIISPLPARQDRKKEMNIRFDT